MRERTHATNWTNPLVLLPSAVRVQAGQRLRVVSRSDAATEHPSYRFELALLPESGSSSGAREVGTVEVRFADLYPHFDDDEEDESEEESDQQSDAS